MEKQLQIFADFANRLADQTRPIIQKYFRMAINIDDKDDASPVTMADQEAERFMRSVIAQTFPSHNIKGEEFSSKTQNSPYQWVLDPIDGTRSFITGRPLFGTLIALLKNNTPLLGIIDQPILKERWVGLKGHKTRFTSPLGGKIGTRRCLLEQAELSCTSPQMLELAPHQHWQKLVHQAKRMTWGGDCYGYGLLAIGQIDLIMECDMNLWDWAALIPIIEGAGGIITQWNGQPLASDGDRTVLAAGSRELHAQAVKTLSP